MTAANALRVATTRLRRGPRGSVVERRLVKVRDVKGRGVCSILLGVRDQAQRRVVTARVVRPGDAQPEDEEWRALTPAERISAVWKLTKLAAHWQFTDDELRLQRTVGRVQRPSR